MAELKTIPTDQNVAQFLESISEESKRSDCYAITELMQKITGEPPVMWGSSIVGFGKYHYKYESGHEGDAPLASFSPRKQHISLYLMCEPEDRQVLLNKLGRHKAGKGCLNIKKLSDVNTDVLQELIKACVRLLKKRYN